jgi:hypothetical protein
VRCATLALVTLFAGLAGLVALAGCNDLRDFQGTWEGARVEGVSVLRVGVGERASLVIESINAHGLAGTLAIDGLLPEQAFRSLEGAEADALANMTFAGAPLRVYLAFVPIPDGGGEALTLIALYDDRRVEVRVLRGGSSPLYAIFALTS